jgi:hypothetical protein
MLCGAGARTFDIPFSWDYNGNVLVKVANARIF